MFWGLLAHTASYFATWQCCGIYYMFAYAHTRFSPLGCQLWRVYGYWDLYFSQSCVVAFVYHLGKLCAWLLALVPGITLSATMAAALQFRCAAAPSMFQWPS